MMKFTSISILCTAAILALLLVNAFLVQSATSSDNDEPLQVRPFGSRWILRHNTTTSSPGNGTIEFAQIIPVAGFVPRFGTLCNLPTTAADSVTLASNLCRMLDSTYNSGTFTTSTSTSTTDNKNATFDTIYCGSDASILQSRLEDCNMTIGSGWWDSGANPQCSGSAPILSCSSITQELSACSSSEFFYTTYGHSVVRRDALGALTFEGRTSGVTSCSNASDIANPVTYTRPVASTSDYTQRQYHTKLIFQALLLNTPFAEYAQTNLMPTITNSTSSTNSFMLPCNTSNVPSAGTLSACMRKGTASSSYEASSLPSMSMNFEPGWLTSGQWQLRLNPSSQVVELKLKNQTRWSCACGRGFDLATARGLCNIVAKNIEGNIPTPPPAPTETDAGTAGPDGSTSAPKNYDPFYYWASYKYNAGNISNTPATLSTSPENYPAIASIDCPDDATLLTECVILPLPTTNGGLHLASPICTNTMAIALQCNVSETFVTSAPTTAYTLTDRSYFFGGEFSNASSTFSWPVLAKPASLGIPTIVLAFVICISIAFVISGLCTVAVVVKDKWDTWYKSKQIKKMVKNPKDPKNSQQQKNQIEKEPLMSDDQHQHQPPAAAGSSSTNNNAQPQVVTSNNNINTNVADPYQEAGNISTVNKAPVVSNAGATGIFVAAAAKNKNNGESSMPHNRSASQDDVELQDHFLSQNAPKHGLLIGGGSSGHISQRNNNNNNNGNGNQDPFDLLDNSQNNNNNNGSRTNKPKPTTVIPIPTKKQPQSLDMMNESDNDDGDEVGDPLFDDEL